MELPRDGDWRRAVDSDDEWWRESTCSSCSDSEYDEWPATFCDEVASKQEVFYIEGIECNSLLNNKWKKDNAGGVSASKATASPRSPTNWRKGAQGTLMKLVRRSRHEQRANKRSDSKAPSFQDHVDSRPTSKVTFHDNQNGEMREVRLLVEPRKHNLGRRATLCETLLGLVPGHFSLEPPDNQRIMVAGFIPDMEATRLRKIKIGDWLLSIDGQEVSHLNIDAILGTISSSCMVTLKLQRVAGCDVTQHLAKGLEVDQFLQVLCRGAALQSGGSVVLLSTSANEESLDDGEELDEVLYCYPENPHPPLVSTRGIFLTLLHLIPGLCHSAPQLSSIIISGHLMHCVYFDDDKNLVLLAFRDNGASVLAIKELTCCFIKAIKFSFQSFSRAALSQKPRLDLLIDSFYNHYSKLTDVRKYFLPAAQLFPLPRESMTGVHNALSELESADFDEKGKKQYNSPRQLSILGSCFFYKGLTVCSHLPVGILSEVQAFCWLHGLYNVDMDGPPIRRLLAWKQVYLNSGQNLGGDVFPLPPARHFILLLGQNHYNLAVLLESTQRSDDSGIGPNILYVELAQTALDNIHNSGVCDLIDNWLDRQVEPRERPQHVPSKLSSSKTADQLMRSLRLNSIEQGAFNKSHSAEGSLSLSSLSHKSQKVTSILKQHKMSARSSENSEETCSQSASDGVLRATSDTSSEDSWEPSQDSVDHYDSTLETCDPRTPLQGLLLPTRLIEGLPNCFLHYFHLETDVGIILSSDVSLKTNNSPLLASFYKSCISVQSMLQPPKKADVKCPWVNQSIAAINELGVMFESPDQSDLAGNPIIYWVVGKHLSAPHSRQVFVCYEDSMSLSLVELAFRLALTM